MRIAAEILKGKHIAKGVRCIVIPGTQKVYLQCIKEGLAEIFVNAAVCFLLPPAVRASAVIWVYLRQENVLFPPQTETL